MKINDDSIKIDFNCFNKVLIKADSEQISRVFVNLVKNSIESLNEKYQKNNKFIKKIIIEITEINDYIEILIIDNGIGFNTESLSEISKPYFTTKKKGSGLGLSIVAKIINDHNGAIEFLNYNKGAKIKITFPKLNVS
ncbi:MAG: ATP-binding protein [Candidatus Pelagibacter sp.]